LAEDKNKSLKDEEKIYDIQVEAQNLEKIKLIDENKKAKMNFLRNEETMIEYQTLTYKQGQKI
jgi:hypothetical protein